MTLAALKRTVTRPPWAAYVDVDVATIGAALVVVAAGDEVDELAFDEFVLGALDGEGATVLGATVLVVRCVLSGRTVAAPGEVVDDTMVAPPTVPNGLAPVDDGLVVVVVWSVRELVAVSTESWRVASRMAPTPAETNSVAATVAIAHEPTAVIRARTVTV